MSIQVIPSEVKAFIVRRYACYDNTGEIREAVKQEFGLELTTEQVARHNPELAAGAELGQEWRELFAATRRNFQEALDDIGIVHKAYRLRKLDEMERKARANREWRLASELLRQAAEEVGGMFEKGKTGISLETLQKEMDKLAQAVVRNVQDPEILRRIEEDWGSVDKKDDLESRIRQNWSV